METIEWLPDVGDRVVINHREVAKGPVHGVVVKAREKAPRGKTPGLWLNVVIDPPKGIKKWEVEIHANHVRPER